MAAINANPDYDKVAQLLVKRGAIEKICEDLLKNGKTLSEGMKENFITLLRSRKSNCARLISSVSKICSAGEFEEVAFSWISRDLIANDAILRFYMIDLSLPANKKLREDLVKIALKQRSPVDRLNFMSKIYSACSTQFYAAKDKSVAEVYINNTFRDICLLCSDEIGKQCAIQAMEFFDGKMPKKSRFVFLESLQIQANSPEMCKMIENCFESPTMTVEVTVFNFKNPLNGHYLRHKNRPYADPNAAEAALEFIETHLSEFSTSFLESLLPKCERRKVSVEGGFPFNLEVCYTDPLIYAKERLKYLIALKG